MQGITVPKILKIQKFINKSVISKLRNSVSTEWTFPHHGFTEIFDLKHGKDFSVKKNKTRIFQWLRDASQKKISTN